MHKGTRLLKEYRSGKKLHRSDSILAKCADCMCGFIDGRADCEMPKCPLYPFMPYRKEGNTEDE